MSTLFLSCATLGSIFVGWRRLSGTLRGRVPDTTGNHKDTSRKSVGRTAFVVSLCRAIESQRLDRRPLVVDDVAVGMFVRAQCFYTNNESFQFTRISMRRISPMLVP